MTAFGISLAVMVIAGFAYVTRNGLFYEYLFGSGSSVALIEASSSTLAALNETIFGNTVLNKLLFFVFWMVIGLIVYVFISGIGSGVSSAEHTLEEVTFVNAQKLRLGSELGLKVVLRIIAAGLLLIYGILMVQILVPFGILCARIVAGNIREPFNWLYGLLGFFVLSASIYIGTVLLRFFLLRPRVFGGWEDVLEDELQHGHN